MKQPAVKYKKEVGFAMRRRMLSLAVLTFIIWPFFQTWAAGLTEEFLLPPEHWAYRSMYRLVKEGLLPNYPGEYILKEKKRLTRFEMAYYLKNLIMELRDGPRSIRPDRTDEYILKELILEFRDELTALGMNVTYLNPLSPSNYQVKSFLTEGYEDLDSVLNLKEEESPKVKSAVRRPSVSNDDPHYFVGQYNAGNKYQDYFLFIPENYLEKPPAEEGKWEVLYQTSSEKPDTYLMVKGDLPLGGDEEIRGYYLFPLALDPPSLNIEGLPVGESAVDLLTQLYQSYRIKNLRQLEGRLPLNTFKELNPSLLELSYLDKVTTGVQIGDLMLTTGIGKGKTKSGQEIAVQQWGVKLEEGSTVMEMNATYLLNEEKERENTELQRLNLDFAGILPLNEVTSIHGGLGFGYDYNDYNEDYLRRLSLVNSLANAGMSLKLNDYLSLLADYTIISDLTGGGNSTRTSLGFKWGENNLLVLGYQLLSLESSDLSKSSTQSTISGELSLRF